MATPEVAKIEGPKRKLGPCRLQTMYYAKEWPWPRTAGGEDPLLESAAGAQGGSEQEEACELRRTPKAASRTKWTSGIIYQDTRALLAAYTQRRVVNRYGEAMRIVSQCKPSKRTMSLTSVAPYVSP